MGRWRVGTPRRALFTPDGQSQWPPPPGGDSGSVALPSRQAALDGTGTPEVPSWGRFRPLDGAFGPILAVARYSPPTDLDRYAPNGSTRMGMPQARNMIQWIRRYHDNTAGVVGFIPPRQARTGWTVNYAEEMDGGCGCSAVASPIPHDRRRVTMTLNREYNADALWSRDEGARPVIQSGLVHRRNQSRGIPKMRPAWFPKLTVWTPPGSYGQTTLVLAPTAPGVANNLNPMATMAGAGLSRFSV